MTVCGAALTRCTGCDNAVAGNLDTCPRCGATEFAPGTCRKPAIRGQARCDLHGGKSPQASAAATARATEAEARAMLERLGGAGPVGNPFRKALEVAGEAYAWLEVCRGLVAELREPTAVDAFGVDRARAALTLYSNALRDVSKLLTDLARLDLDRLALALDARVADRDAETILAALGRATAELPPGQAETVRLTFAAELQRLTAERPPVAVLDARVAR